MYSILATVLAAATAGLIYFFIALRRNRNEMLKLPCPPMKSWFWGHLDIAGECQRMFPPGCHQHLWVTYIQNHYKQGPFFYLDWWPLGPRWLFISDPEISSTYITSTQNLPKDPLETDFMNTFLGDKNMVSVEGQYWKNLRMMFNPGFSASHLMTLVPYIVDTSVIFCDIIREKAKTNELFELEEYATRLTIDIIGKVVFDSDFDSQKVIHPIVETFRERVALMPGGTGVLKTDWFEFRRRYKLWLNGRELNKLIGAELDRKVAAREASSNGHASEKVSFKNRKRSVIDLALDAYQKEFQDTAGSKKAPMNKDFRDKAIDSMKTFIFAGHDTTASTIAYAFYLLHLRPKCHAAVVEELDNVFGKGASTESIATQIKADPYIVNKLEYISAVFKETLRLFPPASTLRYAPSPGMNFTDPASGQTYPLHGFAIWPIALLIMRNPRFFPRPEDFIPERFIPSLTPFATGSGPNESLLFTPEGKDAWRPFEKGPRACIGQELAMLEQKIILAMCIKDFDFVAETEDGVKVESWTPVSSAEELPGQYERRKEAERKGEKKVTRTVEGHVVYQILKGSAKPMGGMRGRMSLR